MRLLIISNMAHYNLDGEIVGWGPAVQEIDHLAEIFSEIRHVGCLHESQAPASMLPYQSQCVRLVALPPAGGETLASKLRILRFVPRYVRTVLRELSWADVVHVRCPANISLLAVVILAFVRKPRVRWVKYAGNWQPQHREARSYTLQRWWLRKGFHRGAVTVNGEWSAQPTHVYSFLNPCLTKDELHQARRFAVSKIIESPVRLLYVGRVEEPKGIGRALEILSRLAGIGHAATLEVVGDGPQRPYFERLAADLGVAQLVTFHGALPRPALATIYARSHIMLLPTRASEGWPKVLSEGMAYGVVPVTSNVSSIPSYLAKCRTGQALKPHDLTGFVQAIVGYAAHPSHWKRDSNEAVRAAAAFTYDRYLEAVKRLLAVQQGALSSGTLLWELQRAP
jgi:glycosyltransferase involved in cell wall biosynthesis